MCGTANKAAGTATTMQTLGDCLKNQCDGSGSIVSANDNADIKDDSNPCTIDGCNAGLPTHVPAAAGGVCGVNQVCDAVGNCVGCVTAATCPGQDDECKTRTCAANVCSFAFMAAGTPVAAQTSADCKKNQCDGAGAIVSVADNSDLPVDAFQCTNNVCTAGVPSNPPLAAGTACTEGTGTTCNATGQCVQCLTAATCPGQDTECATRTCTANVCGVANTPVGTATAAQTPGDCKRNECNGAGAVIVANQDTDVPADSNLCTNDVCTAGVPSHTPVAAGTSCGVGIVCNATGTCLGCNTGADCPGADTECQTRTCVANVCGFANMPAGTATTAQTVGDCKQDECDGAGAVIVANHDADVPSDAFQCTSDTCAAGVPSHTPVAAGTACNQSGGTLCDAIGDCVQCNTASNCPGTDTDCHVRTCVSHVCGVANTAAGNPTSTQTAGNCQVNQCDGNGNAANVADNADVPVDSKQCTSDVCTAGVPTNPPLAAGTACTQSGGTICDGAGACTSSTATASFFLLRVGDGSAALAGGSTVGFIERRYLDGTSAGATLNLPIAVSGANQPLTFAGSSTAEGNLSLSADGHYVTLAGYAAAPGVASIAGTTSAATNRVVGRINAAGVIDTSTLFTTAFSGSNIRAATSSNGTSFWAAGGNSGVQYIQLGQSTATQLNTAPVNNRFLHVFNGQLYGSSGSGAFVNVFTVGTGLPTTTGQPVTSFAGMPITTASPYSFVLFDRNPLVTGLDTLYVADDRATASGGGIQKWTFDGTTWTLVNTLKQGITSGVRGLAGIVTGTNVTLVATTTNASANVAVVFVDDGSATPAGTTIATAPMNTVFRGVAFAPN